MSLSGWAILSSRRAYEYPMDGIRLSVLCTTPVQEQIRKAFAFQSVEVGAPPGIFGEIPPTSPPVLVFQVGEIEADGSIVPIRSLMFDARRIVVDVAGPSIVLDRVKKRVEQIVKRLSAPDGRPILTAPTSVADQSDVVFDAELPASLGLNPVVWTALKSGLPASLTPALSLTLRSLPSDYFGLTWTVFLLEPRADSRLSEHHWFSSAPLSTELHASYLERLVSSLVPALPRTPRMRRGRTTRSA